MNSPSSAEGRPLVIIESPFAAFGGNTIDDNLTYLRRCLRDSYERGEHPFASHGFYPFFLHDSSPLERKDGIEFGYSFWKSASLIAFYIDLGWSRGMHAANQRATELGILTEHRSLNLNKEHI